MKTNYLLLTAFLVVSQVVFAQNDTITGVLLDINNKVIKNHPVSLGKIAPFTATTDKNGIFTFPNVNLQDTLYIGDKKGKNPIAIPINGYPFITIKSQKGNFDKEYLSEPDEQLLRYLQQLTKAKDKTGDLTVLRREEIEKSGCNDIECLVKRLIGVSITNGIVYIRGGGFSKYGTNGALIVLDGVVIGQSLEDATSGLLVEEIEDVFVLADASRYGAARGANGAIVINTRRN